MFPFAENVSFSAVGLAILAEKRPATIQKSMKAILALVEAKSLKPASPLLIYGVSAIEDAFRHMQSGKSMAASKIV